MIGREERDDERIKPSICGIDNQEGRFGGSRHGTGRGQTRDKQAIRDQAEEVLSRERRRRLCPWERGQGTAVESGFGDRGEGHRFIFGKIRRLQLQAFPGETERGRGDLHLLRHPASDPGLRGVQVAQKAQDQEGEGQAPFQTQKKGLRRAAGGRRLAPRLARGFASQSDPPRSRSQKGREAEMSPGPESSLEKVRHQPKKEVETSYPIMTPNNVT